MSFISIEQSYGGLSSAGSRFTTQISLPAEGGEGGLSMMGKNTTSIIEEDACTSGRRLP